MSKIKGNRGEQLAADLLESEGYEILERNYRHSRSELDLIALWKNEILVFVEVKLRTRKDFGDAESFVSDHQQERIREAAEDYIHQINWQRDIRFDIITVDSDDRLEHLKDAFY